MPVRLIINADDFGLTPGINRAVIELHQAGVVTSATLMATGPAFDDAVELALRNPALGVGCHLVFTGGLPVSHPESIPTLLGADGKSFRTSVLDFAQAMLRGTIDETDLARETQAQIQRIQRAGIDVTHIDTHKHTHMLPSVAGTVLHIAERCGIGAIRNPMEPKWCSAVVQAPLLRRVEMLVLEQSGPRFNALAEAARRQELVPAGTLGIAATGSLEPAVLRKMLDALVEHGGDAAFELLCHPGYDDEAMDALQTRLRASREVEYATLLEVIPEYSCNGDRLELIHYGSLGVPGLQRATGQYARNSGYEKVL